jgi:hypothetical protein
MRSTALTLLVCLVFVACGAQTEGVELTASSVTWTTYDYELSQFDTILGGSYDGETLADQIFDTWILENEYLEVTLLPDFGGRILSIVSKTTGNEQLYQNPIGVPYQIGTGVFYYDWLMVYGGIFPTFPEPEHGKAWFLPWEFEVVEDTAERVTISMQFTDDIDFPFTPDQYSDDATGLTLTYLVTLEAGRAAVDTTVVIENPTDGPIAFEYWTNATFAPGSPPGESAATAAATIVAPVETISIPSYWTEIAAVETPTTEPGVFEFDDLRAFGNWPDMGIAYAYPDISDATFWGVIDRERGEGIIRIADNRITQGLKLWTWGYEQSAGTDPDRGPNEARPYVELWAGLTTEFFEKTTLDAGATITFDETYAPTVGLDTVTGASDAVLVAMSRNTDGGVDIQILALEPDQELTAIVSIDGVLVEEAVFTPTADAPTTISATIAEGATPRLIIHDDDGNTVFDAELHVGGES